MGPMSKSTALTYLRRISRPTGASRLPDQASDQTINQRKLTLWSVCQKSSTTEDCVSARSRAAISREPDWSGWKEPTTIASADPESVQTGGNRLAVSAKLGKNVSITTG